MAKLGLPARPASWSMQQAGIDMMHVPYRGSPPALADLIAGRVHVMFDTIPTSMEHIKAGTLRGLAVTSSAHLGVLPDLPTAADYLPGFEASVFFGLGAPRGTPADIVMRLNQEINMALSQPEIASRFSGLGATVLPGSPADFGKLIADERMKWARVISPPASRQAEPCCGSKDGLVSRAPGQKTAGSSFPGAPGAWARRK